MDSVLKVRSPRDWPWASQLCHILPAHTSCRHPSTLGLHQCFMLACLNASTGLTNALSSSPGNGWSPPAPCRQQFSPLMPRPLTSLIQAPQATELLRYKDTLRNLCNLERLPPVSACLQVYCVHTEPNHSMPWQRKRQYPSSSSGFVAAAGDKRWILTNAHSVDYHTQVGYPLLTPGICYSLAGRAASRVCMP